MTTFQVGDTVGFTYGWDTVWGTVLREVTDGFVLSVVTEQGGVFSPSPADVVAKVQVPA